MAGSSRMTRWTESKLASTQIKMMATAAAGSSCQGVKNASSVGCPCQPVAAFQPNSVDRPTPIP